MAPPGPADSNVAEATAAGTAVGMEAVVIGSIHPAETAVVVVVVVVGSTLFVGTAEEVAVNAVKMDMTGIALFEAGMAGIVVAGTAAEEEEKEEGATAIAGILIVVDIRVVAAGIAAVEGIVAGGVLVAKVVALVVAGRVLVVKVVAAGIAAAERIVAGGVLVVKVVALVVAGRVLAVKVVALVAGGGVHVVKVVALVAAAALV